MRRNFLFLATLVAAIAWASTPSRASDMPVNVPATELAASSADLINRAVDALVAREGESRITRLWVFPTADANVVFVHYRTNSDPDAHEPGPSTEHLVLLEMSGTRIASLQDLTSARAPVVAALAGNP